jgi:hypothetical protein
VIALALAVGLVAGTPAQAAAPAWQWPVESRGDGGAWRIVLTEDVYRRLGRADLRDLVAINAAGKRVPFGPAPFDQDPVRQPRESRTPIAWFELPRAPGRGRDESLELNVARDADGSLRLAAQIGAGVAPAATDLLLDLGTGDPVLGLQLGLAGAVTDLRAAVDVYASSDLRRWSRIATGLPVLSLRQGDFQLQRLGLAFDPQAGGYLLLAPVEGAAELPVAAIDALRRSRPPQRIGPQRQHSDASLVGTGEVAGRYEYRSPGPVQVHELVLAPAEANSVANVIVESRDDAGGAWRERARFVAFRVADGRGEVGNEAIAVSASRDRQWRVSSEPPLLAAPALALGWRTESFVLLAQGPGPYRLATGDAAAPNPVYPVDDLLAQLRGQLGPDWRAPLAALGSAAPLEGAIAVEALADPGRNRRWLLWGVLVVGALGIVAMVVRLLRAADA